MLLKRRLNGFVDVSVTFGGGTANGNAHQWGSTSYECSVVNIALKCTADELGAWTD